MTPHSQPSDPSLVVLAPEALRGRRIQLSGVNLIVGRGEAADVRLEDPYVSRTHAVLRRQGSQVLVQDLGSTGGTTVNGRPALAATRLAPGDRVRFADVEMVFQADARNETSVLPAAGGPSSAPAVALVDPPDGVSRFDLHNQQAGIISNVGRDQHLSYVAHVHQERESFLRQVAATKDEGALPRLERSGVLRGRSRPGRLRGPAQHGRIADILGSPQHAPSSFPNFFGTPVFGSPLKVAAITTDRGRPLVRAGRGSR